MKYKLPKFPDFVIPTFKILCNVDINADLNLYRQAIQKYMDSLKTDAQKFENLNFDLASEIALKCNYLLDNYDSFPPKKRNLILGAVRYFINDVDPLNDALFASGFDDDASIINYVLEQLGVENMFINLRHY